jgi:hypothetical protein
MITITDLQTALLDLLQKVHDSEIRLIAGGGFGIYLKTNHVRHLGMRTFLYQRRACCQYCWREHSVLVTPGNLKSSCRIPTRFR